MESSHSAGGKPKPSPTAERLRFRWSGTAQEPAMKLLAHHHGPRICPQGEKLLLQNRHLKAGVEFAGVHVDKEKAFQQKVRWSDVTKIELFGHNEQRNRGTP